MKQYTLKLKWNSWLILNYIRCVGRRVAVYSVSPKRHRALILMTRDEALAFKNAHTGLEGFFVSPLNYRRN